MNIGGRAYKNGVRLFGKNYTVKAYYEDDQLKYQIGRNNLINNKLFLLSKKIPVIRGMVSLIFSLIYFFKEATSKPKRYWPILLLLSIDIILEIYFTLMPESSTTLVTKVLSLPSIFYILLIITIGIILRQTLLKDIFKFHGAEHKAVNYYESNYQESLNSHSRLARRCGTNIIVFYLIIIHILEIIGVHFNIYLESLLAIGLAYEILLIAPQAILSIAYLFQKFTTIEPDGKHLAAAETALQVLIQYEKNNDS